jgi:hypothetical protein
VFGWNTDNHRKRLVAGTIEEGIMDLTESISIAKNYAKGFGQHFADFFVGGGTRARLDKSSDDVLIHAVFCLVLGVLLQDRYLSLKQYADINFMDRAIGQIIFWTTIFLIVHVLISVTGGKRPPKLAFMTVFTVFPISFMTAAYVTALTYFSGFLVRALGGYWSPYFLVWAFTMTQSAIILIYLPRELARHGETGRTRRWVVSLVIMTLVLIIDFAVAYAPLIGRK